MEPTQSSDRSTSRGTMARRPARHRLTLRDHVPGWNLAGNEPGASCDGDSGPQGAHNDPKPGNHPELGPVLAPDVAPAEEVSRTAPASAAPPAARSRRRRPSAAPPA